MEPIKSTGPMLGRVLQAAIFLATVFVVSGFARTALAAPAPFCDDRGATALAAPPDLQAPDDAIERARAEACGYRFDGTDADAWRTTLRPGRLRVSAPANDPLPVRLASQPLAPPVRSAILAAPEVPRAPPRGASSRVERPPRV
jgi:hypothetical protein